MIQRRARPRIKVDMPATPARGRPRPRIKVESPVVEVTEARARVVRIATPVDVGGPGHQLRYAWAPAAGADAAEVRHASVGLVPAVFEESAPAAIRADGGYWIVAVPANRRVRALGLNGFTKADGTALASFSADPPTRLIVAFPKAGGGFDSPRFAFPQIAAQNAMPATLGGASWSSSTLTLTPAVAAPQLRLALVTGGSPAEFVPQATRLASVQLVTHATARDLKVVGPDGATLWTTPEFDPDGPAADVDLTRTLTDAFNAALAAGGAPEATVTVSAATPARAVVAQHAATGILVRNLAGVTAITLEGAAAPVPLAAPFAAEAPSRAIADLRIRYAGLRLLPDLSDLDPAAGAPSGSVVGGGGITRPLPPAALIGLDVARLGLRGMAPEAAELAVELVDALSGQPLAPPAVAPVEAGDVRLVWARFAQPVRVERACAVRVRANSGRFLWAVGARGALSLGIAIADPDPGGRPIRLGAAELVRMEAAMVELPAAPLPAAPFAGAAPLLASELFVTVELGDLRLEYAR